MNFFDALKVIDKYSEYIGKTYNGEIISDLIVVPSCKAYRDRFILQLQESLSPQKAICSFMEEDVHVEAWMGEKALLKSGLFCSVSLEVLKRGSVV